MNIKIHRYIQKKKQSELAEHLGVALATMSRYENNIGQMPTKLLVKAALFLNTTPDELLQEYIEEQKEVK